MKEACDQLMTEGKAHYDAGRVKEAIRCLKQVITLDYGHLGARAALVSCYGLINEMPLLLGVLRDTAEMYPAAMPYTSAYLFCLNYFTTSREVVLQEHTRMMKRVEEAILDPILPTLTYSAERKIRIGYVAGDFREHSCSYLTFPLLKLHNKEKFDIFLYSNNPDNDHKTELFKTLGHWRDIRYIPDPEAKRLIQKDGIDILVDLSGHTIAGRTSLFFRRAAPIQMSWYGYLNTIGTSAIQYRLTDALLSPEDMNNEAFYKEQLIRLPRAFLYEPPTYLPEVSTLPALKNGFFTFGALHNIKKTSDQTLTLWCEILHRTPQSKLLITTEFGGDVELVLRERFAKRGIGPERLITAKDKPIDQFFTFFEHIDLILDTFPYTSGVSAMHGIWMGTPTLTITGTTELERNCAAVNVWRGIPEFVAENEKGFIEKATALAKNPAPLVEFRKSCRSKAVVDNPTVVTALEEIYIQLVQKLASQKGI